MALEINLKTVLHMASLFFADPAISLPQPGGPGAAGVPRRAPGLHHEGPPHAGGV